MHERWKRHGMVASYSTLLQFAASLEVWRSLCHIHACALCPLSATPTPAPLDHRYKNWGVFQDPSKNSTQPDNALGQENCGVANWTQRAGTPDAWGWDDRPCNHKYIFMCRVTSEWPGLLRQQWTGCLHVPC